MAIFKKITPVVVGLAVFLSAASASAEVELKPYGVVHYRLRGNLQTASGDDTSGSFFNYANHFGWRTGVRATVNEQLSLQLQIGNAWAATEAISWRANNPLSNRLDNPNLHVSIASAKWNPGPLFLEVGVLPLTSNGTLDLLDASLSQGHYGRAGHHGWTTETENSLLGLRLGAPVVQGDVSVGVELFQSIIDPRGNGYETSNAPSLLLVLDVPVSAGALKITPQFTTVINRNYSPVEEKGDHEIIGGFSTSYKVSDGVTVGTLFGYGTVSNENSIAGEYAASPIADQTPGGVVYTSQGLIVGANASIAAGPGTLGLEVKFNNAVNTENETGTDRNYLYTDIRYTLRPIGNFSITPRYRTFYSSHATGAWDYELLHRFEIQLEGSF